MSILHADNPTTSLGHPHSYSGNFLRALYNQNVSGSLMLEDGSFADERWLLDNDLLLADSSYVDKLLGLNNQVDDSIVQVLQNDSSDPTTSKDAIFFGGRSHQHLRHLCRQVLIQKIPEIGIRYWDGVIFTANFMFFLFLLIKLACVWRRRVRHASPANLYKEFFVLIFLMTLLNMGHAVGSATLSLTNQIGSVIDQAVWFGLKFCLFTTEICILFFGLCFGQSSSARGICCGLLTAVIFSLLHSAFQSIFDFRLWDEYINWDFLRSYGYAELNFWVVSSALVGFVYLFVGFVPLICCRHAPCILNRCSFFIYCLLMSLLNFAQSFGAILLGMDCADGLCISDLVALIYFTLFAPLVYLLFVRQPTRTKRAGGGLFSYRTHKNDPNSEANGYYPRFSGLISPSYDDLFDYDRIMREQDNTNTQMENILRLDYDFYHNSNDPHQIPLMSTRTPDSTLTTHIDSDPSNPEGDISESRPIIRAPYTSSSFNHQAGQQRFSNKPKNLQVREDGRLTFSTTSSNFNE